MNIKNQILQFICVLKQSSQHTHTHTHLDCQFGDAGLGGSSSVIDADVHAVVFGVIQAERPHFHDDVGCVVWRRKQRINTHS